MTKAQTLLVLGGSSGIGSAVAAEYAARGWNVVLTVRDVAAGEREAAQLRSRHNAQVRIVPFDLLRRDDYERLARGLESRRQGGR